MWVAGPSFRGNGPEDKRREGDPVPEAATWKHVRMWERRQHVRWRPDDAIAGEADAPASVMAPEMDSGSEWLDKPNPPKPDAPSPASDMGAGDEEEPAGTSPDASLLSTPEGGDDGLEQEAPPPLAPPPPPAPVTGDALMQALEQAPFEASASQPDAADDKPAAKSTPKRKRKTTKRKPRKTKAKSKSTRAKRGARTKE